MFAFTYKRFFSAVAMVGVISLQPASADSDVDPLEGFNRSVYSFNKAVDRVVYKPLAQAYTSVTPDLVEKGVHNFFSNIGDVTTLLNSILQLKGEASAISLSRIMFNTTFGLGGVLDVATPMGLREQIEDFGQTLGYWGAPSGPYVVLPLLGPSNVRDTVGLAVDINTDVWGREAKPTDSKNVGTGLRLLDRRVQLFPAERLVSGDEYVFVRDAYMQRREFLVQDGRFDQQFDESDF